MRHFHIITYNPSKNKVGCTVLWPPKRLFFWLLGNQLGINTCRSLLFGVITLTSHREHPFRRVQFSSVAQLCPTLGPHGLQHTWLPCPPPSPGVCSNSCPLSLWCHPTISFSVAHFSCPPSLLASGSFLVSWLFASGGQSIGVSVSASVLSMKIHCWFPLGLTGLISLLYKGFLQSLLLCILAKSELQG